MNKDIFPSDRPSSDASVSGLVAGKSFFILSLVPVGLLLAAVVVLLALLGGDAITDYSWIALISAAALSVSLAAWSRRAKLKDILSGLRRSCTQTLPAVPLLVLISTVAGTWMLSGVVPVMIDLGLKCLSPGLFLFASCAICAFISVLTGSSWTTIATIGVAFMGIGLAMGYSAPWIAGAVISGAYFGDKMSPLSDTTVIASSSCSVNIFEHIRYMMLTTVPAMSIALIVFILAGVFHDFSDFSLQTPQISVSLRQSFSLSPWLLVIPALTLLLIALRVNTLLTLSISTVSGIVGILVFQPGVVQALFGSALGFGDVVSGLAGTLWTGSSLSTGDPALDNLVATSGITGMWPTIRLVLSAMIFGGVMLGTGMIAAIASVISSHIRRRSHLVGSTVASGLFLNSCTADQYLSIILGANVFKETYSRFGLEPKLLSRTLEDSISVTSVLIPWNNCGVVQSTVLGVPTLAYLPFCVFNYLCPLTTLAMAVIGYKVRSVFARKQMADS